MIWILTNNHNPYFSKWHVIQWWKGIFRRWIHCRFCPKLLKKMMRCLKTAFTIDYCSSLDYHFIPTHETHLWDATYWANLEKPGDMTWLLRASFHDSSFKCENSSFTSGVGDFMGDITFLRFIGLLSSPSSLWSWLFVREPFFSFKSSPGATVTLLKDVLILEDFFGEK